MKTAMNIGTVVDKDSLDPLTDAIIRILQQPVDQETKRHAIDALARMTRIEGVTISHCVINGDRSVSIDMQNATVEDTASDDLSINA
nr:hypothetical protein [Sphingomonas sp. Y57]